MKKVVLLGDSIRLLGYGTVMKDYLPKDVELWQNEDNDRFAKYTLRMLFEHQADIEGADVIHWNNGLWDTCTLFGDEYSFSSIPEYCEVMSRIADILLRYGKKVIFSTTTPIRIGQPHNTNERIERFNKAVTEVLSKKGVIINDLYGLIVTDINKYIREDDCIHLTDIGIKDAAAMVSKVIIDNL